MRLAVCALSAVLLSGCSWLGSGGQSSSFGNAGGAYGAYGGDCNPATAYGAYGAGACGVGGGYGVAGNGYGAGAGGFGTGAGYGAGTGGFGPGAAGFGAGAGGFGPDAAGFGAGAGGFGPGAASFGAGAGGFAPGAVGFGANAGGFAPGAGFDAGVGGFGPGAGFGTTTLGANAPFGTAVGAGFAGSQFAGGQVVGTQYTNGQYVQGAGVQTVQGSPVYVPQPYPAYYGVPQLRGVSAAALPFGLGLGLGTEFGIGGTVKDGKAGGPADGGGGFADSFDSISYDDAFGDMYTIGGTGEYDISRNTTLLGSVKYGHADGNTVDTGAFTPGTFDAAGNFTQTPGSVTRDVEGEFDDLETWTFEGGVRQYVGANPAFRPYVAATGGVVRNNNVDLIQTDISDGSLFNEQEIIDSSWNPTASAVVGSEVSIGNRTAIGIESGVRWTDNFSGTESDRWSIPVTLRGRVAF